MYPAPNVGLFSKIVWRYGQVIGTYRPLTLWKPTIAVLYCSTARKRRKCWSWNNKSYNRS